MLWIVGTCIAGAAAVVAEEPFIAAEAWGGGGGGPGRPLGADVPSEGAVAAASTAAGCSALASGAALEYACSGWAYPASWE